MSDRNIKFLREMGKYWRKQADLSPEDKAHWAAIFNAKNCDRIADEMEAQQEGTDT